jgi:hypothetical protein
MLLWVEALDFLVENLKMHARSITARRTLGKVKRCEGFLKTQFRN